MLEGYGGCIARKTLGKTIFEWGVISAARIRQRVVAAVADGLSRYRQQGVAGDLGQVRALGRGLGLWA